MKENEQFPGPLQYGEIKQISKSIAKWVWQRFSIEGKAAWHAKRGAKGGKKRSENYVSLRNETIQLKKIGKSIRQIATELKVSKTTVQNWINKYG